MLTTYAARITAPYSKLATLVSFIATKAEKVVVYEHIGDKTEKPHIHLLIVNGADSDTYKAHAKRKLGIVMSGNEDWSFKTYYKVRKQRVEITPDSHGKFITYMSKGKFDPVYVKGYEDLYLAACKADWVDYEKQKPTDKWMEAYSNFFDWYRDQPELDDPGFVSTFEFVKKIAWHWAISYCGVWTPRAAQLYKMAVITYCHNGNIAFDEKVLWK